VSDNVYIFGVGMTKFGRHFDKTIKVQESSVAHESMLTYASDHPVAQAYRQLAQEVTRQKVVAYG